MGAKFTPLTIDDVVEIYGPIPTAIRQAELEALITGLAWRRLTPEERDDTILNAIKICDNANLVAADPSGITRWENGWQEVLDTITEHGVSTETLRPQYFKYDIIRYRGDYAMVSTKAFEFQLYRAVFKLICAEFLQGHDAVIEVCCGTGLNLMEIGETNPSLELIGYDWARPSQQILAQISQSKNLNLKGHRLDLWTLDGFDNAQIPKGRKALLTSHGLEQLGGALDPFFNLVEKIQPDIVVHIEPLIENYKDNSLFDHLAIQYHQKRNYLTGLLSRVRELEQLNQATIIKSHRLGFGSVFHEGYSVLAWKPHGPVAAQ
jgi:hypothetical protein